MTEIRVLVIRADGESVVTYHALARTIADAFMHADSITVKEPQAQVYLHYKDLVELQSEEQEKQDDTN